MKTKFRVYIVEKIEYCYTVEAENSNDAADKVMDGDYDDNTYEILDSYDSHITDIEEVVDEE